MDPISDQFPHVSTFNYAENTPIGSIDLWGLQSYPMYGGEVNDVHKKAEKFRKENPKTAAVIAATPAVALTGGLALEAFGARALLGFAMQEGAEAGFEAATGIPVLLDPVDLMQLGLKKTGKTVLGHVEDNYQDLAKELDASAFHFEDEVWDQLVEQGVDMGKLNMDFLDEVIKQGDEIILSRPAHKVREGSVLEKEINYLLDNGLKWANDAQTKLIPK